MARALKTIFLLTIVLAICGALYAREWKLAVVMLFFTSCYVLLLRWYNRDLKESPGSDRAQSNCPGPTNPADVAKLTVHYILNVTDFQEGTLLLDGQSRPDKEYVRYNNVAFEPSIWANREDITELVEKISHSSVEDCDAEGIYNFWETIVAADEMTYGDKNFIIVDGKEKGFDELEAEHEQCDWETFGMQGGPYLHEAEIVEGPLFTLNLDYLVVERASSDELLKRLKAITPK